jgi:hypothetical protein
MRNGAVASLLVVAILAGAGVGYLVGASNQRTVTSVSVSTSVSTVTATFTMQSPYSDCGFVTSCSTTNPAGMTLSMQDNATMVKPNGSLTLNVNELNPTDHYVNLSVSNNWFLSSLSSFWLCYGGTPPYGVSVFRGYYTLQNVSSASDVIHLLLVPACAYEGNITGFSFPPHSSFVPHGGLQIGNDIGPQQIYAVDGNFVKMGNNNEQVYSLWSSKPAAYTIAVGDEWGDLVLLHFSVT